MKSKIGIIGCGWLGFPLAKFLIAKGFSINGSTSTKHKLGKLASAGINPFLLKFSSNNISGDISKCLSGCKTLILNIPPGLRKNPERDYLSMMTNLINPIENSSVDQVLFIGSTSIYEDILEIPTIDENSKTSTSTIATKLLQVEELLQKNKNFDCTILRFSGLIGNQRHPAKYLSGKSGLKNPKGPVNLIDQKDCIHIIETIITNKVWNNVFNASFPSNPEREEFYVSACKTLKLPIPLFDHTLESEGKIISSNKLIQQLDYRFKVDINN